MCLHSQHWYVWKHCQSLHNAHCKNAYNHTDGRQSADLLMQRHVYGANLQACQIKLKDQVSAVIFCFLAADHWEGSRGPKLPAVKAILETECCLLVCKVNDGMLAVRVNRPCVQATVCSHCAVTVCRQPHKHSTPLEVQ